MLVINGCGLFILLGSFHECLFLTKLLIIPLVLISFIIKEVGKLLSLLNIMTNDIFQKRSPNHYLYSQWCIMCMRNEKSLDHLFLHCPLVSVLWNRVFYWWIFVRWL